MRVTINGFEEKIQPGSTIDKLIDLFEERDHTLIVELNGRFIHPGDYKTLEVREGDRVEMIHPAFGG